MSAHWQKSPTTQFSHARENQASLEVNFQSHEGEKKSPPTKQTTKPSRNVSSRQRQLSLCFSSNELRLHSSLTHKCQTITAHLSPAIWASDGSLPPVRPPAPPPPAGACGGQYPVRDDGPDFGGRDACARLCGPPEK